MTDTLKYQAEYRRHLPHIQPLGATLFVTFRLAGSLPGEVIEQLIAQAEREMAQIAAITDPKERGQQQYLVQRRQFGRWDACLDKADYGPTWLRDARIAQLVGDSLHYRHGRVYDLDAFCIMFNHVHVVFRPLPKEDGSYHALPRIMHSLKSYTANEANSILGRRGAFWQGESGYDHVIRDEAEWQRIIKYILENPVKAGLVDHWEAWPWTFWKGNT